MPLLLYGGPILVGFVFGYFFTTPVIVIMTVVAAMVGAGLMPQRNQEIGGLVGVIVWIVLGIGVVTMWGTHFYVTGADLGLPDLFRYIFRE